MVSKVHSLYINGAKTSFNVIVADTLVSRFLGWMFIKEPVNEALLLSNCNSVHTCFLRFNLDIIFLDPQNKVLMTVENYQPFRLILPVKDACQTLELPANTLKELRIKNGDTLAIR